MYILFKNQTTLTKKTYIEVALSSNKTLISFIIFFTAFGFIDIGYESYMFKEYILFLYLSLIHI